MMANILILGGTGWLGQTIARMALHAGDSVTCLARGHINSPVTGTEFIKGNRDDADVYSILGEREWDLVVEVSWQPGWVKDALHALASQARHWAYVSSCAVYSRTDTPGADESADRAAPMRTRLADQLHYGAAKAACEAASFEAVGGRLLIARPGLIGGPGDPSNRTSYWPTRFALAARQSVLIPEAPNQYAQVIDVRDLAGWLLSAGKARVSGSFNAVGASIPLSEFLTIARTIAAHEGAVVPAGEHWLRERKVNYWTGPRSLPLWLSSSPDFAGYNQRDDRAFLETGGVRRTVAATLQDTLEAERTHGLDRPLKVGLTRSEEVELIGDLQNRRPRR